MATTRRRPDGLIVLLAIAAVMGVFGATFAGLIAGASGVTGPTTLFER